MVLFTLAMDYGVVCQAKEHGVVHSGKRLSSCSVRPGNMVLFTLARDYGFVHQAREHGVVHSGQGRLS